MKSVWWVIRMFSVSTALTKQRNTVVPFPITTLRPTHQLVAPQGRTDIRAYPSYNKKSRFDAHSVNCSVPKASASFLSNHTWQSIFSEATDTALKASHLCLSLESFSSLYIHISIHREWNHIKKIHYEAFKKYPGGFITECQCVAIPKWTFTWEAPENSRPCTVSYRQPFCTSLSFPYSKSSQTQHANISAFQPVLNKCFFLLFFNDRCFPLNFHALAQIILQSP